jgi:hypothetical protein
VTIHPIALEREAIDVGRAAVNQVRRGRRAERDLRAIERPGEVGHRELGALRPRAPFHRRLHRLGHFEGPQVHVFVLAPVDAEGAHVLFAFLGGLFPGFRWR